MDELTGEVTGFKRGKLGTLCDVNPELDQLDIMENRVRELQGFLRGLLLDGVITRAETVALWAWMERYEYALQDQHPFREILPYLRLVLQDPLIKGAELREELHWMWVRLQSIQLRHPSPLSDLQVFLGLVQGALADNRLSPEELDHLLRWLKNCPSTYEPSNEQILEHIQQVLLYFYANECALTELRLARQYLQYISGLLAA